MIEKEGHDAGFITAIHDSLKYYVNLGLLPEVHHWLVRIKDLLCSKSSEGFLEHLLLTKDRTAQQQWVQRQAEPALWAFHRQGIGARSCSKAHPGQCT